MKLQLIKDASEAIEGYKTVLTTNFMPPSVNDVIDNSCEIILVGDILDLYTVEVRNNVLASLVSKLRLNGEIFISGIESRAMCKMYLNNYLSSESLSSIISNVGSLVELDQMTNVVQSCGLEVETSKINGHKYEIRARRSN